MRSGALSTFHPLQELLQQTFWEPGSEWIFFTPNSSSLCEICAARGGAASSNFGESRARSPPVVNGEAAAAWEALATFLQIQNCLLWIRHPSKIWKCHFRNCLILTLHTTRWTTRMPPRVVFCNKYRSLSGLLILFLNDLIVIIATEVEQAVLFSCVLPVLLALLREGGRGGGGRCPRAVIFVL
ncbi:unnamed protein product [Amoebophrya sp. A120]|nr:unnamed protein product [Amoebophrya sp. A120]|eukprot:GSA120T00011030001.1